MNVATILRFLQLYSHNAHNLLGGETFFQDHEFLGGLYPIFEDEYDSVIERLIGLGEKPDLIEIQQDAVKQLVESGVPKSFKDAMEHILGFEKGLCTLIEDIVKEESQGTIQLMGDIANRSEMRQYKLKQRLK